MKTAKQAESLIACRRRPEKLLFSILLASMLLLGLFILDGCAPGTTPLTSPPTKKPDATTSAPSQKPANKALKPAGIEIRVNAGTLSQKGLELNIEITVTNPNSEAIELDNVELIAKSESGRIYLEDTIPGKQIAQNAADTLSKTTIVPLTVLTERLTFTASSRTTAGDISFPLKVTRSVPELRQVITAPSVNLSCAITFTEEGLIASIEASVNNPNPIQMDTGVMKIIVLSQGGEILTTSTLTGASIAPDSTQKLLKDIIIPTKALDDSTITVRLDSMAGVSVVSFPLKSSATVKMPRLTELITAPVITINTDADNKVEHKWASASTIPVLQLLVRASVKNDNAFPITIGPVRVNAFKPDGTQIASAPPTLKTVVPERSTRTFSPGWLTIGSKTQGAENLILFGMVGKDITIRVDMEVGLENTLQKFPLHVTSVYTLTP